MVLAPVMAPIARPVLIPPVKVTMSMPGCDTRLSPTWPRPVSTFSAPAGNPASSAMRSYSNPIWGVISDDFRTTVLPAAGAGASFCASSVSGEFHGLMAATTPIGTWSTNPMKRPRGGTKSPCDASHTAA